MRKRKRVYYRRWIFSRRSQINRWKSKGARGMEASRIWMSYEYSETRPGFRFMFNTQLGLAARSLLVVGVKGWIFSPWGNRDSRRNGQEEGATSWRRWLRSGEQCIFTASFIFQDGRGARDVLLLLLLTSNLLSFHSFRTVGSLCKNDAVNLYCLSCFLVSTSLTNVASVTFKMILLPYLIALRD